VTSDGTPSLPGATVVFTATVQRNGAGTTDPTSGTITFYDGATVLGTGSVAHAGGDVLDGHSPWFALDHRCLRRRRELLPSVSPCSHRS
jgi:hypothetical protein